jgi:alkylation response protein AidB-like acyl-CoA dehydrogenase
MLDLRAGEAATIEPPDTTTKVVALPELIDLARESGRAGDPVLRQKLAQLATFTRTGEWMAQRARAAGAAANAAGFANLGKLAQTRIVKLAADVGMDLAGPGGLLGAPDGPEAGRYPEALVFSTASSIYGGTDQIQRNVIAERALGLPREPSPDRDRPFAETLSNAPRENRG